MSILEKIQKKDNFITFNIKNNEGKIYTSLVNAIRRTILSDIKTWCINPNETTFFDNTSVLNNEFIAHRLSLVPIRCDIDVNYDSIIIECKKKNEEEDVIGVYVDDFVVKDKKSDKTIDNNLIFPYTRILLANLRYNQSISFECKLEEKAPCEKDASSAHCCVCTCVHTFVTDEERVAEESKNMTEEEKRMYFKERVYETNKYNQPVLFNMNIESIGQYEQTKIVRMGIEMLKERINKLLMDIRNRNERVRIQLDSVYGDIYEIIVFDENDTLGNLLTQYAGLNPIMDYTGYVIRHPLRKEMLMKFKLKENNTFDNVYSIIEEGKNKIFAILDKIHEELE